MKKLRRMWWWVQDYWACRKIRVTPVAETPELRAAFDGLCKDVWRKK